LLGRDFQPFTLPDALDPLVVHAPAGLVQQRRDGSIPVTAIPASQLDDVFGQALFISTTIWNLALGGAMLAQSAAGPTLGDVKALSHKVDAPAPA